MSDTTQAETADPQTAAHTTPAVATAITRRTPPSLVAVLGFELAKLRAQVRARWLPVAALVAPIAIVAVVALQPRPPKDTLFGRFATENGFAMDLTVLGFAAQWAFPLLVAIVAGDIFASEDQQGTWKTVLTRSASRGQIFVTKSLCAFGFSTLIVGLMGLSTIVSSWFLVGHTALTGLTGQPIDPPQALSLVSASWLITIGPALGFTALAIMLSILSRNPAVGIAAPVVIGLVMQLLGALGGIDALRPFLLTTPFETWHGLFADPSFTAPMWQGIAVSIGWVVACLATGYVVLKRRDFSGG